MLPETPNLLYDAFCNAILATGFHPIIGVFLRNRVGMICDKEFIFALIPYSFLSPLQKVMLVVFLISFVLKLEASTEVSFQIVPV